MHGCVETGFLTKYLIKTLNLPKNPVSLDLRMGGQKPDFSTKYLIKTLNLREQPGFLVRSAQVLYPLHPLKNPLPNLLQLPPIAILNAGLSEIRFM